MQSADQEYLRGENSGLRAVANFLSSASALAEDQLLNVLAPCLKRLFSWRVPPNWSQAAWFAEISQVFLVAACEAAPQFEANRGVEFPIFLQSRIMARALTHYRREWKYGYRFIAPSQWESSDGVRGQTDKIPWPRLWEDWHENPRHVAVEEVLSSLPEAQCQLIKQLFWEELTESQIGTSAGLTQRAINKRKQVILRRLRKHLNEDRKSE